jgi:hypothetical protein
VTDTSRANDAGRASKPPLPRVGRWASAVAGVTQSYIRAGPIEPGEGIRPTGPAAASVFAAGIGALTLGGASLAAAAVVQFDQALVDAGRLFVPGGAHLGRFGGQQLLALVAWLASWALLHRRWRSRQVSLTKTALALVSCLFLATLLCWPPVVRGLLSLVR